MYNTRSKVACIAHSAMYYDSSIIKYIDNDFFETCE